ncbi:MAG: 4Fe-4S cluster-binding domain-containing protein [Clostridia bacterium]|nr:4Fe-4S cluster-binding domain-containing protein [Clostridia bacterium]
MNTPVYSGIITNYVCTAACRHCMFASSPACAKEYITAETAEKLCAVLEAAGTSSVHIGGGEPFVNFAALCTLIEAMNRHGIGVDYIETNAFWCGDEASARKKLTALKKLGVECIMISVDPFHIEYVPLERPLKLMKLLSGMDFDSFIWQERYLRRLMKLDRTKTHTKEELAAVLGKDYITDTAREYGLGMNGRALAIAGEIYENQPAEQWITDEPCTNLISTVHCHLDLYGNVIPSGCPGLAARAEDYLTGNIPAEKYPVMHRLLFGGTNALYAYAKARGFTPDAAGYPTKCAFCWAMREFLHRTEKSDDLNPASFYTEMRKSMGGAV